MKSKKLWIYVLTASLVCLSILFMARTIATEKQQYQEELRMRLRGSDGVYILVDVLAQTNTAQEELKQQFEEDVDLELQESDLKNIYQRRAGNNNRASAPLGLCGCV